MLIYPLHNVKTVLLHLIVLRAFKIRDLDASIITMASVSIVFAKSLAYAAGFQLEADGALVVNGKTVLQVAVSDGRISSQAHYGILGWIAQNTPGRAALAIRYAGLIDINQMGTLGLSYKAAPNLYGSFQRLVRYSKVLSENVVYQMEQSGQDVLIHQELFAADGLGVVLSPEAGLAVTASLARQISNEDANPKQVLFRHKPSLDAHLFETFFNCEVIFDAEVNGMLFSEDTLNHPNKLGDVALSQFLITHLDQEMANTERPETLAEKILNIVSKTLTEGVPKAAELAVQLGMSERTLHRRLADDGQTYRELCDETRKKLASNLLRNTNQSLAEIAYLTGFSEQSAFNRAFKRWNGQTPADFRGQIRAAR